MINLYFLEITRICVLRSCFFCWGSDGFLCQVHVLFCGAGCLGFWCIVHVHCTQVSEVEAANGEAPLAEAKEAPGVSCAISCEAFYGCTMHGSLFSTTLATPALLHR